MNALSAINSIPGAKTPFSTGKATTNMPPAEGASPANSKPLLFSEGFQGALSRISASSGDGVSLSLFEGQHLNVADLQAMLESDGVSAFSEQLTQAIQDLQDSKGTVTGTELLKTIADLATKLKGASQEVSLNSGGVKLSDLNGSDKLSLDSINAALDQGYLSQTQFNFLAHKLSEQGVASPKAFVADLMKGLGYQAGSMHGRPALTRANASEMSFNTSYNPNSNASPEPTNTKGSAAQTTVLQQILSQVSQAESSQQPSRAASFDFASLSRAMLNQGESKVDGSLSGIFKQEGSPMVALPKAGGSEWAPVSVDRNSASWSKELVAALGDRLKMQVNQQVKEATVRLDPPELGKVDFSVKMEGDRVTVQINSGNSQVRDLLMQQVERLRSELSGTASGGVDVHVGDGKQQSEQQKTFASSQTSIENNFSDVEASEAPSDKTNNKHSWLSTSA